MGSTTRDELRRVANETFGWSLLRDEQLEAMEQVMAGHDLLAVLPTGAGKSAIYQVPAVLLGGPTLVVSPLIALQQDQLEGIEDSRAPEAVAVNSAQRSGERQHAWKHPRVIALTATAALPVRNDIAERLGLREHRQVTASCDRPNLHLAVQRFTEDADKRHSVITGVSALTADPATRRGLVYTASRKDTEFYAGALAQCGVRCVAYHAGMKAADRQRLHEQFLADELDVIVATSAFGMGIDKPDVRFVVHASIPDSLDSYYQQIGRAGRDGQPAKIILFYRPEDLSLQTFLTASKAPRDALGEVAHALTDHTEPVPFRQLKGTVNASAAKFTRAVNLLEQAATVGTRLDGRLEYLRRDLPAEKAVQRAVDVAQTHERLIQSRIEMMRGYAEMTGCRRQYLLGYFGEQLLHRCSDCDTCDAGTAEQLSTRDNEFPLSSSVQHANWGHGVVMSIDEDRLTVLFDDVGYKTLSLPAIREHQLLRR